MIRCYAMKCRVISDEPEIIRVCDGPSEAWGSRRMEYSNIECCPACGSENIEVVGKCQAKDCDAVAEPHDDFCAAHRDEMDERVFDLEAAHIVAQRVRCLRLRNELVNIANGIRNQEAA